jgi:hypothetical protein
MVEVLNEVLPQQQAQVKQRVNENFHVSTQNINPQISNIKEQMQQMFMPQQQPTYKAPVQQSNQPVVVPNALPTTALGGIFGAVANRMDVQDLKALNS